MGRRQAREGALQTLYAFHIGTNLQGAKEFVSTFANLKEDERRYMSFLVDGAVDKLSRYDQLIEDYAVGWSISRINTVDRCILQMAMFELEKNQDVPHQVVVNEAVELAKKFSTEKSHQFINGILARVIKEGD